MTPCQFSGPSSSVCITTWPVWEAEHSLCLCVGRMCDQFRGPTLQTTPTSMSCCCWLVLSAVVTARAGVEDTQRWNTHLTLSTYCEI